MYIYKAPNQTCFCGKCGKPLINGQLVVPKGKYTSGIPKTVHRECYVDAHGEPVL